MLILASATSSLTLTTSAAVTVDVHASYVDRAGAGAVGASIAKNTAITTAATTTIVAAPAASTERNIKTITIRNKHASTSVTVTVLHTDGTANVELYSIILVAGAILTYDDGNGWKVSTTAALTTQQVITTGAGTYTTPAGVRAIRVETVGGGGAGGGVATAATNSGAAGGGGSGGYSNTLIIAPASSYTYSVGAGGTAGAAGANAGNAGGDTTFGATSVCTAKAGAGGLQDTVATIHVGGTGGTGGNATLGVGDFKAAGAPGGTGFALAAAQAVGGTGASSVYGGGAAATKTQGGGFSGGNYGSGGGGGVILSGGASVAGGAGAGGCIIVTEYR